MLTKEAVTHVAHLARLRFSDADLSSLTTQLGDILKHFEEISAVDTAGIEPLITPIEINREQRADEVEVFADAGEQLLKNAPERQGNLFKVPPVVG